MSEIEDLWEQRDKAEKRVKELDWAIRQMVRAMVDTAAIGKLGGEARSRNLTDKEKSEAARFAVNARWDKARAKAAKTKKAPPRKKGAKL